MVKRGGAGRKKQGVFYSSSMGILGALLACRSTALRPGLGHVRTRLCRVTLGESNNKGCSYCPKQRPNHPDDLFPVNIFDLLEAYTRPVEVTNPDNQPSITSTINTALAKTCVASYHRESRSPTRARTSHQALKIITKISSTRSTRGCVWMGVLAGSPRVCRIRSRPKSASRSFVRTLQANSNRPRRAVIIVAFPTIFLRLWLGFGQVMMR